MLFQNCITYLCETLNKIFFKNVSENVLVCRKKYVKGLEQHEGESIMTFSLFGDVFGGMLLPF